MEPKPSDGIKEIERYGAKVASERALIRAFSKLEALAQIPEFRERAEKALRGFTKIKEMKRNQPQGMVATPSKP